MVVMTEHTAFAPVLALTQAWASMVEELSAAHEGAGFVRLKVWLDCRPTAADVFRSQVDFVDYVDSPHDADVRIQVKPARSRGESRSCTITFIGLGRFENIEAAVRVDDDGRRDAKPAGDVPMPGRSAGTATNTGAVHAG